jgi:hypothetical protein
MDIDRCEVQWRIFNSFKDIMLFQQMSIADFGLQSSNADELTSALTQLVDDNYSALVVKSTLVKK